MPGCRATSPTRNNLPIQGATIQIKAASTGATRHVVTNEHGLFEAAALLPDDYELKTEAQGFATATQTLRLKVGERLVVDISMKLASLEQGVKVDATPEVSREKMKSPHFFAEICVQR